VTYSQSSPQVITVPLAQDNELRLAKMRRDLEDIFRHLHVAIDEVDVSAEAARSRGVPEVANVLTREVSNRIFRQLKALTNVIERLGGQTDLSDDDGTTEDKTPGGGAGKS
jgi:hypothetical protein